jgi:hypothetical protein
MFYFLRSAAISANGANGKSDIEVKAAREAVSECGQRASFNWVRAAWRSSMILAAMMSGSGKLFVFNIGASKNETSLRPYFPRCMSEMIQNAFSCS